MEPITGLGQFNNFYYPQFTTPLYDFNMFSIPTVWTGNPTETTKPAEKTLSYEEYVNNEVIAIKAKNKERAQLKEQKAYINAALKETSAEIAKLESGVVKGDKVEILPELKEMSKGQKVLRGGMNILTGTFNVLKSLAGFDSEGKWHLSKCLKNVAIAAGVAALCVFAAPLGAAAAAALGGGAIAAGVGTAIAAAPTVMAATGLATGVYMAGKGAVEASKCDTVEEFDKAYQDIGAGIFIGASSAAGLKGISKSAGVASTTGGLKGSLANTFVNPWKAASANFDTASTIMARTGGGFKGFRASCQYTLENPARMAEKEYQEAYSRSVKNLKNKLKDTEALIRTATNPKEKALLDMQFDNLFNDYADLVFAKNTAQWRTIGKSSSEYIKDMTDKSKLLRKNGEVEIKGVRFEKADKSMLKAQLKDIAKEHKSIRKDLVSLRAKKFDSMYKWSKHPGAHAKAVEDFGFSTNKVSLTNLFKTKAAGIDMGNKKQLAGKAVGVGFIAMDPVFLLQPVAKNPYMMGLNSYYTAVNPFYEESSADTTVTKEEYNTKRDELLAQKKELEAQKRAIEKKLKA